MDRGKEQRLTSNRVASTALHLVDEHGLEGLSMRTLAAELGVTAMALYRHVPNKATLLDRLVDAVTQEIPAPQPAEDNWEQNVRDLAGNFRRTLLAHSNILPLFSARPAVSPHAVRLFAHSLAILQQAGFDEATVVPAYYTVFTYTLGFVTTEASRSQNEVARAYDEAARKRDGTAHGPEEATHKCDETDRGPEEATRKHGEAADMLEEASSQPGSAVRPSLLTRALSADMLGDQQFDFGLTVILRGLGTLRTRPEV